MLEFSWLKVLVILLSAGLISFLITWLIKKLAVRFKHFDWPDKTRKFQELPMPLAGGLAIYFSLLLIIFALKFLVGINLGNLVEIILIPGLVLVIGGLLDEKFNLKSYQQILFPIISITLAIYFGLRIQYITNPFGGIWQIGGYWLSAILVFVWLLGMIYTTKILDGQDGLATGVGLIGSVIIFFISWSWDKPQSAVYFMSVAVIGVLLGFLIWNFFPAKIYLGESGSTLIGFIIGVLALATGAKIAATLLVMSLPILDLLYVIIQRIRQGVSPFSRGDRQHLHYRLQDSGLSIRQTVLALYLITLAFSFSAIAFRTTGKIVGFLIVAIIVFGVLPKILRQYAKIKKV